MFRRARRLRGMVLVAGLLLALGASRPHIHGPEGAPVPSCVLCHAIHERSLPPAPVVALSAAVEVELAEPAPAPWTAPDASPRARPRTRAPPA